MPYYLHAIDDPAESGTPYDIKQDALAQRVDGQTVTFRATDEQRELWQARERRRFDDDTYTRLPWEDQHWAHGLCFHYAHLSIANPGMLAYTPSDEHGIADRQLRVRPGKYLREFAPTLSADQIEKWTARCRAIQSGMHIARSTEEITTAYVNGPRSCMSEEASDYDTDNTHPTAVYGESDLALAYLGDLSSVSARCIIWPDKMLYGRSYGDDALRQILESQGYTYTQSFTGARIRRISLGGDRYVMPYLDCGNSVASRDGMWEIVSRGTYNVKNTDGTTGTHHTCEHCNSECDEDQTYCDNCNEDYWSCESCGDSGFDQDGSYYHAERTLCESCYRDCFTCHECNHEGTDRRNDSTEIDGEDYCEDCAEIYTFTCAGCDEEYTDLDKQENAEDIARGTSCLCDDCAADHVQCKHCDHVHEAIDVACPDCGCLPRCLHTRDLLEAVWTAECCDRRIAVLQTDETAPRSCCTVAARLHGTACPVCDTPVTTEVSASC